MIPEYYPSYHQNEIYNAPEVLFLTGATKGATRAAKYLGISYPALLRYTDDLGLTVIRRQCRSRNDRHYLMSELRELKGIMETLSRADVIKVGGNDREVSILQDFAEKKRSKAKVARKNGRG